MGKTYSTNGRVEKCINMKLYHGNQNKKGHLGNQQADSMTV
jgi:hypothetical protein